MLTFVAASITSFEHSAKYTEMTETATETSVKTARLKNLGDAHFISHLSGDIPFFISLSAIV